MRLLGRLSKCLRTGAAGESWASPGDMDRHQDSLAGGRQHRISQLPGGPNPGPEPADDPNSTPIACGIHTAQVNAKASRKKTTRGLRRTNSNVQCWRSAHPLIARGDPRSNSNGGLAE